MRIPPTLSSLSPRSSISRIAPILLFVWLTIVLGGASAQTPAAVDENERVTRDLVLLYDFASTADGWIRDKSGFREPLDLKIEDPKVAKLKDERLFLFGKGSVRSKQSAQKVVSAIQRSGEVTVEAWVESSELQQTGPARVVSISQDSSLRNVTLGQDGNQWDVRLRSSSVSTNGIPSLAAKGVRRNSMEHVVFTRTRGGDTTIFLNGEPVQSGRNTGSLRGWDRSFRLALGDEFRGGRAWKGSLSLVAIYGRALKPSEVRQNWKAGSKAKASPRQDQQAFDIFARRIAPILAEHCSECHDAATREGGLDLTHKATALASGSGAPVIVPGKPYESRLLESILSDEMPLERPPLSATDKQLLSDWITDGAKWSMDFVDPALYVHGDLAKQQYVQRLTVEEYIATVKTTFDVDIESDARRLLPNDLRADGFANTAYNLSVDLKHIEAYRELAALIAAQMDVRSFAQQFSKSRKFTDKTVGALIETMGEWVLRRPLSKQEVIAYRGISTTVASAGGDFDQAVSLILQAMLQSPQFLYRVENQLGDGTPWPVSEHELATRMSYILWGSSPDRLLFEAAKRGDLVDAAKLEQQVDRMLRDPRLEDRALQFLSQWLNLNALSNLNPSRDHFPNWNPVLAEDMRRETLAFFQYVALEKDRPLSDILHAQYTFATPRLAKHYRLELASSPTPNRNSSVAESSELTRYDVHTVPARGGLLTQGSVLTIGGDDASMVTRGLFVLHNLLRGVVKDPPPCVDTTPVASKPGLTQRLIAQGRIQSEACGGCHSRFEPLAFGLERFDGLGTYHERDVHGNALREDGKILIPGEREPREYASTSELMRLLANNPRVKESLTWKVTQFAVGRPLTARDASIVDQIHQTAQATGGSYRSLVKAIVMSELVQFADTERSANPDDQP